MAPKTPAQTSIDNADAICDCPGAGAGGIAQSRDEDEYFTCSRCARLQHNDCCVRKHGERTGSEHWRCNLCQAAARKEKVEKEIKDGAQVREMILQLFWWHYCHLPDGNATRAVKDATKMKFQGGILVPEHPAPKAWIQAVQKNLDDMMEASGKKLIDFAIRPEHDPGEMEDKILEPMREIANDLLRRGAYQGNRGRLGVLAEVLGLERKGMVWKG